LHKIRLANPRQLRGRAIAHHTHDVDSVMLAVLAGVPVIMPLRQPEQALASFAVYKGGQALDAACRLYLGMCKIALGRPEAVLVADFETILIRSARLFDAANRRFGLSLAVSEVPDAEINRLAAHRATDSAKDAHGHAWESKIGVPSEDRDRAKRDALATLQAHPLLKECCALHGRLRETGSVV
jgi:hypothetical protein